MDIDAYNRGINNESTAGDMGVLFTKLASGQVVTPTASSEILGLLTRNSNDNVDFLTKSLSPRPQVAHIAGVLETNDSTPEFHHDAGVFYYQGRPAYILSVFTSSGNQNRKSVLGQLGSASAALWQAVTSTN